MPEAFAGKLVEGLRRRLVEVTVNGSPVTANKRFPVKTKKKKPAKKKPMSRGSRRMRDLGMKLVTVWLDPAEAEIIEQAAAMVGKPVATYVRDRCFALASTEVATLFKGA